ncbi:hypothetical protein V8Z80_06080 [Orrella sp. JC864]|uniref:hypothetical protein n=1 Tax=Orrella sp. JC864 TaxID=3120298 RepID=UPI00300BA4F6
MTLRVISITTSNYLRHTIRLVRSVRRVHPDAEITVYGESDELAPRLAAHGARMHILPEIATLGVKRAKFYAYAHAAQQGGFIYLDGDIVVLEPLQALCRVERFTACRDDLSGCDFIEDKAYPWVNDPALSGERYFNSGVFAVPQGLGTFFESLRTSAASDEDWLRYIIPGKLHDNHYLCAKLAQQGLEVDFVPEHEYNWQGFTHQGRLDCHADDDGRLRSNATGATLRLVHFAGIDGIDAFLASLPAEVLRPIAKALGEDDTGFLEAASFLWRLDPQAAAQFRLPIIRALGSLSSTEPLAPGKEVSLLGADAASAVSIALSSADSQFEWNGLRCGNAYLSAPEYKLLRDFIKTHNIDSVLEFGAGYTTVLFKRLVQQQIAIEGWEGPWSDFARRHGCRVTITPFSTASGFDEAAVQAAAQGVTARSRRSMIFLDSPQGTYNRSLVAEQIIAHAPAADFYVVHDSVRDSQNVYRLACALNLRIIGHFPSLRGMTFLAREADSGLPDQHSQVDEALARDIRFTVTPGQTLRQPGHGWRIKIGLKNTGSVAIACAAEGALRFSLHFIGQEGLQVAWDTPRYVLPVDIAPGDEIGFWLTYDGAHGALQAVECDFVKEGAFWWSQLSGTPAPRIPLV